MSNRRATKAISSGALVPLFATAAVVPLNHLSAQVVTNDMPVGTCVTAYGESGKIVGYVQGGYRVASDANPNGTPFVASASGTTKTSCTVTQGVTRPVAERPARPATAAVPGNLPNGATLPPRGGACFGSSTGGLTGPARIFGSLIVSNWAAPAHPGSDGAVTVKVDSLRVGVSRRATFWDRDNNTLDARAPVTPVIARVTTCTDYRTRLDYREVQENFLCYTKAIGGLACGETAHTADLPQPRNWDVKK